MEDRLVVPRNKHTKSIDSEKAELGLSGRRNNGGWAWNLAVSLIVRSKSLILTLGNRFQTTAWLMKAI